VRKKESGSIALSPSGEREARASERGEGALPKPLLTLTRMKEISPRFV